ncbi:alpha/beta hydrolase [Paracoccus pantotrophus]|uniref:alpha/beta hydrolase n=1 Tax=Paracoccus pantotrophus TaxID=82367 RepID=UPI000E09794C|nr:alpha/beta hydrolase-fold protein [Paracoccus pantotrophus]RDD97171.1 alpha/beta hydrolase [Paracoccus pantotrophus]WGR64389.1 alpha/beta hydrolase [Paracoccus pantotrophus]
MQIPLSRRGFLAVSLVAMAAGAARAQEGRPRGLEPAERIEHPRASHFDLGPAEAPWRIFLGLPQVPAPRGGYSAILALDGNATFPILWHLREELAPEAPVALVGIGYPVETRFDPARRWFDLTSPGKQPVPAQEGLRGPGDRPTGGQDAFLRMIAAQLLPELGRRLPLDTGDLTLFGHSLGGLFVLNTLFTRPRLFARYAAADPSTWWNAGEPLREARAFRGGILAAGGRLDPAVPLLIANSGTEPPPILSLLSGIPGLELVHRPHPQENHGAVIRPAARQALALHLGRPTG